MQSSSSFLLRVCLDAPQLSSPMLGEHAAPVVDRAKPVGVGSVQAAPPVAPHGHQANIAKHLQMLRDRRLLELERVGDLADRAFLARDQFQNFAAPRFSNGVERIRCCGGARHGRSYIFPYRNMSSWTLARIRL